MTVKLTEARQKAEDARKQIEVAQTQMGESIKEAITDGFTQLFEEYPFLGSVSWSQYTPFFNDGDPCVFSSQFTYPGINSIKDVEDETSSSCDESGEDFSAHAEEESYLGYNNDTRTSNYGPNVNFDPKYKECEDAVRSFITALAGENDRSYRDSTPSTFDSALLHAFGDHALVTVTREGIEVDGYEHE